MVKTPSVSSYSPSLPTYKTRFMDVLWGTGSIEFGVTDTLRTGLEIPWKVRIPDMSNESIRREVGYAYADTLMAYGLDFDSAYGIPNSGKAIANALIDTLKERGMYREWFSTNVKPEPEKISELRQLYPSERKKIIIGNAPSSSNKILFVDDVYFSGKTINQSKQLLDLILDCTSPEIYRGFLFGIDLMYPVSKEGVSERPLSKLKEEYGIKSFPVVNAVEIYMHFKAKSLRHGYPDASLVDGFAKHLLQHGNVNVKAHLKPIIDQFNADELKSRLSARNQE